MGSSASTTTDADRRLLQSFEIENHLAIARDGAIDLVTANLASDSVSVLLGSGTGSFASETSYRGANRIGAVATGDFNGDGNARRRLPSAAGCRRFP